MTTATFVLYVPATGAKNFVQDWIHTKASLRRDITVTLTQIGEMCRITIVLISNLEQVNHLRDEIFGKNSELTKKFWLPIELKANENIEDLFSLV